MAKIRNCKLSWTHRKSDQVAGYRLYWSKENKVTYDSPSKMIGKVNEIYLPEILKDVPMYDEPIFLGIAAVDNRGQESDIAMFAEPYQPMVPLEPADLILTILDEFQVVGQEKRAGSHYNELTDEDLKEDEQEEPARARISRPLIRSNPSQEKVKYYDDVGFRKLD
jgi:hypothetical protein